MTDRHIREDKIKCANEISKMRENCKTKVDIAIASEYPLELIYFCANIIKWNERVRIILPHSFTHHKNGDCINWKRVNNLKLNIEVPDDIFIVIRHDKDDDPFVVDILCVGK